MRLKFAAACLALLSACAFAQAPYPQSRVTLVTHSSPGGGTDLFLREVAQHLGPIMNTSFAVENIRGGSGATAVAHVAAGKPDGSIFYGTTPTYIQTTLLSKPAVGWDGLDPIAIVFLDPEVIYTRTESPYKTLTDVINFAKANPGKSRWGASNPASLERLAMERLARTTGVKAAIVPHDGGGDQMIGVLNGTYDIGIGEIQELRGQLEAGKIRLLGVASLNLVSVAMGQTVAALEATPKIWDLAAAWLVLTELQCPLTWLNQAPEGIAAGTDLSQTDFPVLVADRPETLQDFMPWACALRD